MALLNTDVRGTGQLKRVKQLHLLKELIIFKMLDSPVHDTVCSVKFKNANHQQLGTFH